MKPLKSEQRRPKEQGGESVSEEREKERNIASGFELRFFMVTSRRRYSRG